MKKIEEKNREVKYKNSNTREDVLLNEALERLYELEDIRDYQDRKLTEIIDKLQNLIIR